MHEYPLYEHEEPNLSGIEWELFEAASTEEPWALVEEFSTLERVSGSEDERRAAEYISNRLGKLGIQHDTYSPELRLSIPNDASIRAVSPVERSFGQQGGRPSVKTVSFSRDATVAGEVVHVTQAGEDLESSLADDLDGKIVLLDAEGLSIEAIEQLEELGAAGYIQVHQHEREPHDGIATSLWGAIPGPNQQDSAQSMVIVNVSKTVGEQLKTLVERESGLTVEITADVTTGFFECPVVVARIPASSDGPSDEFVMLHAHYDSWHVGVTDNATGAAGLLECARLFDRFQDELQRDLWVAWWPAHSTGRYAGSEWFADEFAIDIAERCIAYVNMDSPGTKDATEFSEFASWMPEADALCRGAIRDVAGKEAEEHRPRRSGDQSFDNIGVTAMLGVTSNIPQAVREKRGYHSVRGCGGNSDAWHLTTDTIDKADPDVLLRDIRVYTTILARLLLADVVPLDFRRTIARHQEIIDEYGTQAAEHFEVEPVSTELDELAAVVDRFYEQREELPSEVANEVIRVLSRSLVRLGFTSEGQFEQDPAVTRPLYPGLAAVVELPNLPEREYRFLQTHLIRERNRVVHQLRKTRKNVIEHLSL